MVLGRGKAQSITEYAILLSIVALVFVGMQIYVRRGLQGRLRDTSDFITAAMKEKVGPRPPGAAADAKEYTNQFEPDYRQSVKEITQHSSLRQRLLEGGNRIKFYDQDETHLKQTDRIKQVQ